MVSCFKCMKTLPYDCTCPIPDEEKTRNMYTAVLRETELCLYLLDGGKAYGMVGDKLVELKTRKSDGTHWDLVFPRIVPDDWRTTKTFQLMDKDGKSLYRQTKDSLMLHCRKLDELEIIWNVGCVAGHNVTGDDVPLSKYKPVIWNK